MKHNNFKIPIILSVLLIIAFAATSVYLFSAGSKLGGSGSNVSKSVTLTYLKDSSCEKCVDLEPYFADFQTAGINIKKTDTIEISSAKGKSIIAKYKIEKIPTIIFSKELSSYSEIVSVWDQIGTVEKDGSYVMRKIIPPYKDMASGEVKGAVTVTYLTDSSCTECYDVSLHKQLLASIGMVSTEEKTIDISSEEGAELIEKHAITKVPTIILSKEAIEYPGVATVWNQVGTIGEDGSYVFTAVDLLGVSYKDLSTGKVVVGNQTAVTQ